MAKTEKATEKKDTKESDKKNKKKKEELKGNLSVAAENIFPLIKKWLYTEKEIFIREMISNASDAITKLQKLTNIGQFEGSEDEYRIEVRIDAVAKKIIVEDNGIGMNVEEVNSYINEMAFSGASDFVDKFKDKLDKEQIIGHFGLGFYSAFMVSERVEIETLSYKKGEKAAHWSCDGSTNFEISAGKRDKRGTEIILHISDDSKELLDETIIRNLLLKYCKFMPTPISLNGVDIGTKQPLWKKRASDLKDEDYLDFYKLLFPLEDKPLFWIHLNVDYPFHLQGILYFPRIKHELEMSRSQISLYCNQVFVSDNVKDIIPEFLTVLQGALDSPDIPLNVSRSQLQTDPQVRKITTHIIKKIADRLKYLHKNERETYQKYWEDIHPFVKFGAMTNDKFWEQVEDVLIFKTTKEDIKYTNIKEYLERNESKHPKKVYYYSDLESQSSYIELFKSQGFELLELSAVIDPHFVQYLERKFEKVNFSRIDAEVVDDLVETIPEIVDGTSEKTGSQVVEELFKDVLGKDKIKIQVKNLKSDKLSGMILVPEFQRRLKEMQSLITRTPAEFLEEHTLVVNLNHGLIKNLRKLRNSTSKEAKEDAKLLCEHVYSLALLSQKRFSSDEMSRFIDRSNKIMEKFSGKMEE
ncbi:molecular chaperone HtpG [Candidatus Riflebacteria bacterium]